MKLALLLSLLLLLSSNGLMAPRRNYNRYRSAPTSVSSNNNSTSIRTARDRQQRSRRMYDISPSDHLVSEALPLLDIPLSTSHYAGYINIMPSDETTDTDRERNLFYWLFSPGNNDTTTTLDNDRNIPLIIWLNGGPGYSSLGGLFLENGPLRLTNKNKNDRWTIQHNEYSWHNAPSYLLYVDSPVGTGLSYVSNDSNDDELCQDDECIANDFYDFLKEFLWLHKDVMLDRVDESEEEEEGGGGGGGQYVLRREMYIAGESYAGHYIPVIADQIVKQNDALRESTNGNDKRAMPTENDDSPQLLPPILMPLSGIAIGNGFMDTRTQYNDAEYLLGKGMISRTQKVAFDNIMTKCVQMMDDTNVSDDDAMACFWDELDDVDIIPDTGGSWCTYDSRIWLPKGSKTYPPGEYELQAYFGGSGNLKSLGLTEEDTQHVLNAIHASAFTKEVISGEPQRYKVSSHGRVGHAMYGGNYDLKSVNDEVVRLLQETKTRVLFYNGVEDGMCDHIGNERFLDNLPWKRRSEWLVADRSTWMPPRKDDGSGGAPYGFVKQLDNLLFLKIMNAGHLVPMDQPEIALDMIQSFIRDDGFRGPNQKLEQVDPEDVMICGNGKDNDNGKAEEGDISGSSSTEEDTQSEKVANTDMLSAANDPIVTDSTVTVIFTLILISCVVALLAFSAGRWSTHGQSEYGNISHSDNIQHHELELHIDRAIS